MDGKRETDIVVIEERDEWVCHRCIRQMQILIVQLA